MNRKQLMTLWVGITIIVLMSLFPPWRHPVKRAPIEGQLNARYGFILCPPKSKNPDYKLLEPTIDIPKLFIQDSVVAFITLGFILTFKPSLHKP